MMAKKGGGFTTGGGGPRKPVATARGGPVPGMGAARLNKGTKQFKPVGAKTAAPAKRAGLPRVAGGIPKKAKGFRTR